MWQEENREVEKREPQLPPGSRWRYRRSSSVPAAVDRPQFVVQTGRCPVQSTVIRARLNHPIIDSDGHQVEMVPVFLDYLAEVGGASVAQRFTR